MFATFVARSRSGAEDVLRLVRTDSWFVNLSGNLKYLDVVPGPLTTSCRLTRILGT